MPADIVPLTTPPAMVEIVRGLGRYLVDGINWAVSGRNPHKAGRLLCVALKNAGVALAAPANGGGAQVPALQRRRPTANGQRRTANGERRTANG